MKYKPVKRRSQASAAVSDALLRVLTGLLFVILPFITSFTGLEKFRAPKDGVIAFFVLVMVTVYLASRKLGLRFRPLSWEFFLGIGLAYTGLHSIFTSRPSVSLPAFVWVAYLAALLLVLREIVTESFQKKLWLWVAVAAALNAVITILQYLGRFPLMQRFSGERLEGRLTPAGFIGEVNTGGFLFGLVCLMLLYGVFAEKSLKIRLVAAGLFLVNLAGLAFTRTLTALIALVFCLALWFVFHHWWVWRTEGQFTRAFLVLWGLLLVAGLGASFAAARSGLTERVELVLSQMRQGDWTLVTSGRHPIYVITWDMIQDRWWWGRGLNTFSRDFFFRRVGTPLGRSLNLIDQPGAFREAHNEYLQVWEELGLFGLLFFAGVLLWPLIRGVYGLHKLKDPAHFYWQGILLLGLTFVALSCLSHFPFHVSLSAAFIVLLLAGLRHFQSEERVPFETSRRWVFGKLIAFSILVLWLGYPQVKRWRANHEIGIAAVLLEDAVAADWTEKKRALVETAQQHLSRAEELYPGFYKLDHYMAYAWVLAGRPEAAIPYYHRAASQLPSAEVFTDLAAAYMAQGRYEQAKPLLEIALRFNPNFQRGREALAYLQARSR